MDNREIDKLIAKKIMGYTPFKKRWDDGSHGGYLDRYLDEHGYEIDGECPQYSTDIKAAFEVVQKIKSEGFQIDLSIQINHVECVAYHSETIGKCLLKTKGIEVE